VPDRPKLPTNDDISRIATEIQHFDLDIEDWSVTTVVHVRVELPSESSRPAWFKFEERLMEMFPNIAFDFYTPIPK
jgi:hypothetical protein